MIIKDYFYGKYINRSSITRKLSYCKRANKKSNLILVIYGNISIAH